MYGISEGNCPPGLPLLRHTVCYLDEGVKVQLREIVLHVDICNSSVLLVCWTRFLCGKLHEIEPKPGRRADTIRRVDRGQHKCPGNEIT